MQKICNIYIENDNYHYFFGGNTIFLNPKIWSSLRVVIHFDKIFDIVVAGIVASALRLLGFSEVALY